MCAGIYTDTDYNVRAVSMNDPLIPGVMVTFGVTSHQNDIWVFLNYYRL